jgi:fumarate reductase flavoprotein subunit
MDYCFCYGGVVPVSGFQASIRCDIYYKGAVWVNADGERVFNEPEAGPENVRDIWYDAEKNIIFVIFSQNMIREKAPLFLGMTSNSKPFPNGETLTRMLQGGKYAFRANTLAELGSLIGAPRLRKTLLQYNEDAAKGRDSVFGRTRNLIPFDKGPFYAILTCPCVEATAGGPRIDENAQLLRENGTAVGNLYLAGEIVGQANITGRSNVSGTGHGICAVWGRIAAESAVRNAGIR